MALYDDSSGPLGTQIFGGSAGKKKSSSNFFDKNAFPGPISNWPSAAQYAFAPAMQFGQDTQGIADYFKGEMNKDYSGELFNLARRQIDVGLSEGKRLGTEASTRAGFGGSAGSGNESFSSMMRMIAGSGQMGIAAQNAELAARGMRSEAAQNLYNIMTGRYQAMMAPAQLRVTGQARVPVSAGGPSLLEVAGPALGGLI